MIRSSTGVPETTLEIVTDPAEIVRSKAQHEQHLRNSDWLENYWHTLLPQARGKFVAVAGQEAMIADTAEEAWAWAARTHPEDRGATVRYVYKDVGIRIYAHHW